MGHLCDIVDVDALRASTLVRHVELHDTLPSTNDRARELAGTPDVNTPALVVARLQTAGRGRGTNSWWSADGALTFSLILDTDRWGITQCDWPRLSLATAVAVCDALTGVVPQSSLAIKWPNDVLLDGRKVAGILIESPGATPQSKDRLVIGVGINVNNSRHDAPHDVKSTSIAVCEVAGRQCDVQRLLVRFLNALDTRLRQLAANDPSLPEAWRQRSSLTDQEVEVTFDHDTFEGKCQGIADDGALLVERAMRIERIYSGSVRSSSQGEEFPADRNTQ